MEEVELEKSGFLKKEIFLYPYFLNSIKKKINFKQFAILMHFFLKKVFSKTISKK